MRYRSRSAQSARHQAATGRPSRPRSPSPHPTRCGLPSLPERAPNAFSSAPFRSGSAAAGGDESAVAELQPASGSGLGCSGGRLSNCSAHSAARPDPFSSFCVRFDMVWLLQLAPVPSSGVAADDDGGEAVGAAGYDVRCEYSPTPITAPSTKQVVCCSISVSKQFSSVSLELH